MGCCFVDSRVGSNLGLHVDILQLFFLLGDIGGSDGVHIIHYVYSRCSCLVHLYVIAHVAVTITMGLTMVVPKIGIAIGTISTVSTPVVNISSMKRIVQLMWMILALFLMLIWIYFNSTMIKTMTMIPLDTIRGNGMASRYQR